MRVLAITTGLLTACLLTAPPVTSDDSRPTTVSHEHGSSTLSVSVTGTDMTIRLEGPAGNFIGFEHRPSTAEQTGRLAKALEVLRAGDALFLTPPEADCRMASAAASPPDYGTGAAERHTNLKASWQFRCSSPAALLWVDAQLFAKFPATTKLATSVATAAGHKALVLTPGTPRVLMTSSRR